MAVTGAGDEIPYDVLLVATGGHAADAVHGALTFRGAGEGQAIRELLAAQPPRIAFAAPAGSSWPLPLYELALLSAAELRSRGAATEVLLVDPRERAAVALRPRRKRLRRGPPGAPRHRGAHVRQRRGGARRVARAQRWAPSGRRSRRRAATRCSGGASRASRATRRTSSPIDEHARVIGLPHVYAAGDVTNFPVKHGGLAAQQADAAAEAMLAELGLPIVPRPFDPVIQGVLFTDSEPAYLQARLADSAAAPSEPRSFSLWWPPSKIAGRHLSPYLAIRAGAPRTPEIRPDADCLRVSVDARTATR